LRCARLLHFSNRDRDMVSDYGAIAGKTGTSPTRGFQQSAWPRLAASASTDPDHVILLQNGNGRCALAGMSAAVLRFCFGTSPLKIEINNHWEDYNA
jgi:hypothetical protein